MSDSTPVMKQYLEIKKEYEDAILFFRMGDFYEMFYNDAQIAARELGIALTSRDKNKKDPVPMAGIPYHSANSYLTKLLKAGYKVAICEQTSLPGKSKGPVSRDVVRVVTPGTAMNEEILTTSDNNFMAALTVDGKRSGIALVDLSTGEFKAGEFNGEGNWLDELERTSPTEIIISENESPETEQILKSKLKTGMITRREGWTFDRRFAEDRITEHFRVKSLKGFGIEDMPLGISAAGGALAYLADTQKASLDHITSIKRHSPEKFMILDQRTLKNLEIISPMYGDSDKGTLFSVIDSTLTPMGSRLLKSWILRPFTDPVQINRRLDGVQELFDNKKTRNELEKTLGQIKDVERLIGRVCMDRAGPRDLMALADSLKMSLELKNRLSMFSSESIMGCVEKTGDLSHISEMIFEAVVEEPPFVITEGGIFRDGYHSELDELRKISKSGRHWIAEMQERERNRTGINTLKIKYNSVFGYFIEISKSNLDRVPDDYTRRQTLVNAERFITPELKEYEDKVLGASERINELEKELFSEIRKKVASFVREIQDFSSAAAEIDALRSFACTASERGYVRPAVDESDMIEIRDGRHPFVETMLPKGKFVSNDTVINSGGDQILILTGPNMAGKSTYLRQVGLIVLLAQAGSFVPATSAHIGTADRIFTRVGASDNLAGGESTFMVEMTETANILNNCTTRSLVLFDEVGRGTSTFDGLSIAWAIVEYLHQVRKSAARTLFATHYHELTEMELLLSRVKNYNIAVRQWNDEIIFLRKITEGGSDQSLGIQVARLAGLPSKVIERAKEILFNLEANEFTIDNKPRIAAESPKDAAGRQISLFEIPEHPVVEEIRKLDIENMTPVKALLILEQLRKKIGK